MEAISEGLLTLQEKRKINVEDFQGRTAGNENPALMEPTQLSFILLIELTIETYLHLLPKRPRCVWGVFHGWGI